MNTARISFTVAFLAALTLAAESRASRPTREAQSRTDASKRQTRRARRAAIPTFEGARTLSRGGRKLPEIYRNATPTVPSAPTAPSALPTPDRTAPSTVVDNVYRVSASKYASSSPKFRVQSIHGARQVTVGGAEFQGDASSMVQLWYKGAVGENLFLSCTLSMASTAKPTFKVTGGAAASVMTLAPGEKVRKLEYASPIKGTWTYLAIHSETPAEQWRWHDCTLTVK